MDPESPQFFGASVIASDSFIAFKAPAKTILKHTTPSITARARRVEQILGGYIQMTPRDLNSFRPAFYATNVLSNNQKSCRVV